MSEPTRTKPPFRLSREELKRLNPEGSEYFDHSVFILPQAGEPGYKIGLVARSKAYVTRFEESREEDILGHGAFGVVKTIKWENGEIDAVKIEPAKKEEEHVIENQIMRDLGYLKAAFVRVRGEKERQDWIGDERIQDKSYTIQKRLAGIEMKDYFRGVDVTTMPPTGKYEIGLKAALSIESLHHMGILHCDIKPANFMINWEGDMATVSPIDFGLSLRLADGQKEIIAQPRGTLFYIAPEIAEYE
ncbi:MAG: protein kinase [Coxiellaceae bacterium]|jgi:serine/threonine protein kinase|nr:protein kinase [Coxiellaceae bacterium]